MTFCVPNIDIRPFEEKLQNKVHEILLDINSELNLKLDISDEKISVEYALAVKDKLIEIKEKEGLDFVYFNKHYLKLVP